MLRKLKWQIPVEPLAAGYNWWQGPVPGRGPAVEKHCSIELSLSWEANRFSASQEILRILWNTKVRYCFHKFSSPVHNNNNNNNNNNW